MLVFTPEPSSFISLKPSKWFGPPRLTKILLLFSLSFVLAPLRALMIPLKVSATLVKFAMPPPMIRILPSGQGLLVWSLAQIYQLGTYFRRSYPITGTAGTARFCKIREKNYKIKTQKHELQCKKSKSQAKSLFFFSTYTSA